MEEVVAECAGVRPPGYLPEPPPVELAGEARVLVRARAAGIGRWRGAGGGLGVVTAGTLGGEVTRQDAVGEDVRPQDDEGAAVGEPRDDVPYGRVGEKRMQAQGEHLPAGGGGRGGVAALATASRGRNGGGGRRRRLLLLRVGHRGGRDGEGGGSQCHVRSVRDVVLGGRGRRDRGGRPQAGVRGRDAQGHQVILSQAGNLRARRLLVGQRLVVAYERGGGGGGGCWCRRWYR